MKRFLTVLALAGCVEPAAAPSPAVQQLIKACEAGDTGACASMAELEQRERERRSAIPLPNLTSPSTYNYQLPVQPLQRPQNCTYNRMGNTVYQQCY